MPDTDNPTSEAKQVPERPSLDRSGLLQALVRLRPSWLRWAGRGFWALLDQALFAGANFIVGLLLARWLEPKAYGAFSTAFSVFLLIGTLHTALWTEPMLVYGPGRFGLQFASYQKILLGYHWRFGVLISSGFLVLGAIFFALNQRELGVSFAGLAVAAPLVLYLWIARRGGYVLMEPRLVALGVGLYLVLYLGIAYILLRSALLGVFSAFATMGVAAFFSAQSVFWMLRGRAKSEELVDAQEVRALHWWYGRWALLAGALSWVPGNVIFILLPLFEGLEQAAHIKALLILVMPAAQFNTAVSTLFLPLFVRAKARAAGLKQVLGLAFAVQVGSALVYFLVLQAFADPLVQWLYGGKYSSTGLVWLAFTAVLTGATGVFANLLRALERPNQVAWIYACTAMVSLTLGVALVYGYGFAGAVASLVISNVCLALGFAATGLAAVALGGRR